MAVGETRPAADFYVSADLTRTSERRLQAGKNCVLRSSDRDFPIHFGPSGRRAGRTITHTVCHVSHTHSTTRQIRHAASGLDGSRGCACYACRRRESTCGSTLRLDPETRGAMPRAGLRRQILAARLAGLLSPCNNKSRPKLAAQNSARLGPPQANEAKTSAPQAEEKLRACN